MIEWTITSSAMILLVLILRLIVRERVSPRLRYALWGLVLLRLLFPGTVFESKASIMTPVAAQEPYQAVERIPGYIRTQPDGRLEIGHPGGGGWTSISEEVVQSRDTVTYDWPPVKAELESLQRQVNIRDMFLFAWLGGSVAVGAFLLIANLKFSRHLKKNHRQTLEQYRGRWVFVADGLPSPCLFGLRQPCIYLTPEVAGDEAAKAHVLAHEYTHFRQWDHIWALLRGVCLAVHWFNPLVWMAAVLSRRDCELSCDEGAVQLLGEQYRADYGRTLVGLVSRRTTAADLARCATTMTGGKSALKERVSLLVKRPRTTALMAVIVAAACIGFAVCTFTGAAEAEEPDEPPVQSEDAPQTLDSAAGIPSLDELPTEIIDAYTLGDLMENTDPYWLMGQIVGEDIALYAVNPMGTADKVRGIYLRYGEHLQYFDQVASPYIITRPSLFWYDFDSDGDNELLVVYAVEKATTMDINELVIYEWEDEQWSAYKYDPAGLMEDFNANAVFESDEDMSQISFRDQSVQLALGGEACFINGGVVTYTIHKKEGWGILMTLWGQIGPTLTSTNYAFDYLCGVYYHADGTFTEGSGIFRSFYEPEIPLPALEDLPTEIITDPVTRNHEPIWLLAELPAEDIAVYYDQQSGDSLIRSGVHLQRVTQNLSGRALPELHYEDLDGDGDKELAIFYNAGWGTGTYITKLVVYEWDAKAARWIDCNANLEENIIWDFNNNRTLTVNPEQGCAVIGYNGEELSVDLDKRFGDTLQWSGKKIDCELQELYYNYSMESYGLTLTISGEIRPEGYPPTTCYAFDYICNVYYEDGGYFRVPWGYLNTDYLWSPKIDESRLTDTFRDILHNFMRETLEIPGIEEADLVNDYFSICDVNGDGRDELITQRNNGPTAAHEEAVYDQYGSCLLSAYAGLVTYYSNGYATAGWSHNQGRAGDKLWPYNLYKPSDSGRFRYVWAASVDGWDKNLGATYQSFNPDNMGLLTFPDDVDKDGDGFVYYIITEEGGYAPAYGTPVDYAEWAEWAAYLHGEVVTPVYVRLTEENIALIG